MNLFTKGNVTYYLEIVATGLEILGVLVLVIGTFLCLFKYAFNIQGSDGRSFTVVRKNLGRSIILGLEILIAADIIGTIIYDMTTENILNLGLIILIRTFLSFTLEIEIEGRMPWQQRGRHKSD